MLNTTNRHNELHTLLTQLSLAGMADGFADLALRAAKEGLSHEAYLYELARIELEQRTEARVPHDWCGLQVYLWRKPFEPSRSIASPQRFNCNWSVSKVHLSWKRRPILSPLANRGSAKVTVWPLWAMS